MKSHAPHNPDQLRRQAEERLSERQRDQKSEVEAQRLPEETAQTLHELQVHQIELEMQNEELLRAQAEIEAGRERYYDLYDLVPVGYCTLSEQGLILEANLTAATLLDTTRSALVKQPISRFILKDDQNIYYLYRKKLFDTGEPQECELRLVKPGGEVIWAYLTATAAQAEDGTPVCRCVLSDITNRKETEEALRDSEQKFQTLTNQVPAALFLHEMDGSIVDYNEFTLGKYGYSVDELLNINASDIDPDYRVREDLGTFWEELNRKEQIRFEARHRKKNGTIFPVEVNLAPIEINGKQHYLALALDITERKHSEEALRESEALLSRSQQIAHIGSWKLDLTANRLTWSDEVYRIFGCEPQAFAPTYESFLDFVHPDDRTAVDEAYSRSQREGNDSYEIEHRIVRKNSGEVGHVHERCVHERDAAGTIIQSIGMVQDITERKRVETYREMGQEILQILNEPGDLQESIPRILDVLKTRAGVDAAGLRLQQGEDFPYFVQDGFPQDFLQTENTLVERDRDGGVCRDKDGNICLECTCGLVISGKTDPSNTLFTKGGSCWTNDSFPLLDLPSDQDPRRHPRNNCIHQDYASVALIPLRTKDRIVGLIQLNDKRKGRFTLETIEILEGIAAHIGSALMRKRAEEERRHSHDLMQYIVEHTNSGVAIHDRDMNYLYVSQRYLDMYDVQEQHVRGKHHYEVFPDLPQKWRDVHQKALAGEVSRSERDPYVREDGTVEYTRWECRPWYEADGAVGGIIVYTEVITDLIRQEQSLREYAEELSKSEENLRTTLNSIGDAVISTDVDGRVVSMNPVAEALTGWDENEAVGQPLEEIFKIINEQTRHTVESPVDNVFKTGQIVGLANHTLLVAKDGRETAIADSGAPIKNSDGKTTGVVLVFRDQSAERAARCALEASEEKFRSIFASMTEMVVLHELVCDEDGKPLDYRILDCNPAFTQITGIRRDDAVGRLATDVYSSDTAPYLDEYARVALTGEPCAFMATYAPINKHFDIRVASPGKNLFITVTTDITERKRAEAVLLDSEARYRGLFVNSRDAIMTLEPPSWAFTSGNPATLEMFGAKTEAEFTAQEPWKLSPARQPDGRASEEKAREMIETAMRDGSRFFEWTHRRINGEEFQANVALSRVSLAGKSFLQAAVRDITERKRAESELRRLSTVIEQSPEAVVITDTEASIQYVNPAFETVTGYTREEAIGRNPRILKSGQQDAGFYTAMWKTLLDDRVWEGRMVNKRKDGSLYTEDASIAPVKDPNGTIINYVGFKRDITAELKIEDQLRQAQKMESVGHLAGGVAHDFNNMLTIILGQAQLLTIKLADDTRNSQRVTAIQEAAQRSANLTRQLLAFARKETIAPVRMDLNNAVEDLLKMLRRLIGEDLNLSWQPGARLWLVKMDPGQLDQLLANLCVNARDAIGGVGKVTIETGNAAIDEAYCRSHVEASPGDYVMLVVSDDGCGMDRETLAQIFEPFYTTKGVGEGTGLGLATVYGIVKQNNGFINVYSEPGEGTTFRIYLPRLTVDEAADEQRRLPETCPHGSETVLVVEDEPAVREIARTFLEDLGYRVLEADCPAAAVDLTAAHSEPIHLLLTDVVMPGMNGRDLAERLIVDHPHLRVLYISGYTANVIAHRGILETDVHLLSKPFGREELARKVREVLSS